MFYKVTDTETKQVLMETLNQEDKKEVKEAVKDYIRQNGLTEDADSVAALKWDQFVKRLRELGLELKQQNVPFDIETEYCLDGDDDLDWIDDSEYDSMY